MAKDVDAAEDPKGGASEQGKDLVERKRKKRKKRVRGQKPKLRIVPGIGELPQERKTRDGKVRHYNVWKGDSGNEKLPRKTREMLARMARINGKSKAATGNEPTLRSSVPRNGDENRGKDEQDSQCDKSGAHAGNGEQNVPMSKGETAHDTGAKEASKRKFEGMRPGETYEQFTARLRKESKQMILSIGRKNNHQREKKRAYYERRKERVERRKRRRRGEYSDSDVEEDEEDYQEIAHLPSYWQDIVRNNGRPISAKRRKRMQQAEFESTEKVAFGEQVERPPQLTALPKRRGQK